MDEKQIREEFEAEHQHLDLSLHKDSWGQPEYMHSHVEATWRGWRDCRLHMQKRITEARKTLDEVIAAHGQRAGVAKGWCFYSADFSMNASNPANWGTVMLKRGDAGSKWWHALSDEERERIDLFVSGRGTTFDAALKAANEKAAAAPTQQQERSE